MGLQLDLRENPPPAIALRLSIFKRRSGRIREGCRELVDTALGLSQGGKIARDICGLLEARMSAFAVQRGSSNHGRR